MHGFIGLWFGVDLYLFLYSFIQARCIMPSNQHNYLPITLCLVSSIPWHKALNMAINGHNDRQYVSTRIRYACVCVYVCACTSRRVRVRERIPLPSQGKGHAPLYISIYHAYTPRKKGYLVTVDHSFIHSLQKVLAFELQGLRN